MSKNHRRIRERATRGFYIKEQKQFFLIVCEGKKTEKYYFESLKREWQFTSVEIRIKGPRESGHTDPKGIVDFAKEQMIEINNENKDEEIENKNVWCVFDRDAHLNHENAIKMAKDNGFGVAFSNPCFELWYLLHFREQTAHIERSVAKKELRIEFKNRNMPKYEKNMDGVFKLLEDSIAVAESMAKKLRKKHKGDGNPDTHNPSTSVDKLVGHLRTIREKDKKTEGCT